MFKEINRNSKEMKTTYKPIAMRCTQDQFDSIKDRIPLPIENISSFKDNHYLVNGYISGRIVTNVYTLSNNYEIHEEFDGELFLDCCGGGLDANKTEANEYLKEYLKDNPNCKYDDVMIAFANKKLKEYLKDKVWLQNELQFELDGKWYDCSHEYKIRVKPQFDYTAEIEALEKKAKENGQKVIIKFEEL